MTKQHKKTKSVEMPEDNTGTVQVDIQEKEVADAVDLTTVSEAQAVEIDEHSAKSTETLTSSVDKELDMQATEKEVPIKQEKVPKSSGTALALLAMVIALGGAGAGYFWANYKFAETENRVQTLISGMNSVQVTKTASEEFAKDIAQLNQLTGNYQKAVVRIDQLEREQNSYVQQINELREQVKKLGLTPNTETTTWRFSEADFLLNNALRKVVLDNDIDTAKNLLIEADNVLSQISDPNVLLIRDAVKSDLARLSGVNQVDQYNVMQRLAALANLVDDMQLAVNDAQATDDGEVSDSLDDWQRNLEKSADSFLSHFIRISDKTSLTNDKVFIAPNQEIYLRENIRLRLQIAMMAVPRQQNDLYKQSVEAVGSWVRSYFDIENANVKRFLKEIDDLAEQSIYVDAPGRLQSLDLLASQLNRATKPIVKIQLDEEKSLEQLNDSVPADKPAEQ